MPNIKTDLAQYAQLRTMLDSVQSGALRQYLNAPSQEERDASFNYLKTNLKPIHDYVRGMKKGDPCPANENDCGEYCSPYPCTH